MAEGEGMPGRIRFLAAGRSARIAGFIRTESLTPGNAFAGTVSR